MPAVLPSQKIHDYSKSVIETLAKNKITLRELKSLIGKLQFCTIVVPHGTAFLRRLHDLTVGIKKTHFISFVCLKGLNWTFSLGYVFYVPTQGKLLYVKFLILTHATFTCVRMPQGRVAGQLTEDLGSRVLCQRLGNTSISLSSNLTLYT